MINLASLTFPYSIRWREFLKNREGSRSPLGSIQPLLLCIKEKSCIKQRYFKTLLTSLIRTKFTDQLSSLGINPQIKSLILLNFSLKQEPMLTIQSAISIGQSVKRLLVPHNANTFFSDRGISIFLARQSTFSARSPPIAKFNSFSGVKYLCHTFKYLKRPAIMKSPSNTVFVNWFLRGDNGSGDILTSLICTYSHCKIPNAITML